MQVSSHEQLTVLQWQNSQFCNGSCQCPVWTGSGTSKLQLLETQPSTMSMSLELHCLVSLHEPLFSELAAFPRPHPRLLSSTCSLSLRMFAKYERTTILPLQCVWVSFPKTKTLYLVQFRTCAFPFHPDAQQTDQHFSLGLMCGKVFGLVGPSVS